MSPEPIIAIDVERLVSELLRSDPDVVALVDQRVYTELPKRAEYPLIRFQRVGGAPLTVPAVLDSARIQVDAYGGTKAQARTIAATARGVIEARLPGVWDSGASTVSSVRLGTLRYLPDTTFDPNKPRYIGEVIVRSRPA